MGDTISQNMITPLAFLRKYEQKYVFGNFGFVILEVIKKNAFIYIFFV